VFSGAYRELFRVSSVRWEAGAGLLAQITQGSAGIGLILVIRGHSGSLALAGSVVGAVSIAAGLARPLQGRLIDRRGTSALMAACGVVHPAALIGIVALAGSRAPAFTMVVLGAVAGLALPPVSTSMRVVWADAVPETERTAAYSLVYLTQELSILTGPLVLSVCVAAAGAPLGLIVVSVLGGAGTICFAILVGGREAARSSLPAGARGVLREGAMRLLIAIAALTGAVLGALEVAIPTLAGAKHAPAAAGLLVAALSAGGIAGAIGYGNRRWRRDPLQRLLILLGALAAMVAVMIPVTNLVVLAVPLIAGGLALNPALTTISLLVDRHVSRARAAEAFGWLSFGIAGGTGAAAAIAGSLASSAHPGTAFAVGAVAAALGVGVGVALGRVARAPER
jgi:MFS family permease